MSVKGILPAVVIASLVSAGVTQPAFAAGGTPGSIDTSQQELTPGALRPSQTRRFPSHGAGRRPRNAEPGGQPFVTKG